MKAVDMKKAMKRLEELETLRNNITFALNQFDKQETRKKNTLYLTGNISCSGWVLGTPSDEETTVAVDVHLGSEIVKRVKDKFKLALKEELEKIEKEIASLEV